MLSSRTLDPRFPPGIRSCVDGSLERKYHRHFSILTHVAGDARPIPQQVGSASSPAPTSGGPAPASEDPAPASEGPADNQKRRDLRVTTCGRGRSATGAGLRLHVKGGGGASAGASTVATTAAQQQGSRDEASLLSPERGWAEPGRSRASVSTPGTVLTSLGLTLASQLLPPSPPRFVRSGSKCWVRPPAPSVFGPPGTRLTAAPWRAPCAPRARERAPSLPQRT